MKRLLAITLLVTGANVFSATAPDAQRQIELAVLSAPEEQREACTVLGYDATGKVIELREGTNGLICLADDPAQAGFSVACYTRELEPYMRRGRQLREQGMDTQSIFDTREKEVKDGTLPMPDKSILYVLTGKLDDATGELGETYLRYVIYIPYATPESTGIPLRPSGPGGPWIMNPGTHRAHIMINPPRGD